ncbi:MAG TPA: nodulation protein NfeD [bacterium]|nr:nodulation protein NfeD [bacterium]
MRRAILILAALAAASAALAAPAKAPLVRHLKIEGVVSPIMAEFLVEGIERAEEDGAALVVISLDTPGGLDPSMREIIKKVLASKVPVAVYVWPPGGRAASAGTFITLAAHVAAMAPNTSIGAAHPVTLGAGGEGADETMTEKVTNDAASYIKSLARRRGRNEKWAELAVRKSASLSAEDAVAENVVDFVADDLGDLLAKADGRKVTAAGRLVTIKTKGARVEEEVPDFRQRLLAVLTDPNVAYILLIIGFYGLIFELSNPGSILPGIAGGICIILAFYALSTLPVNYAGVALIVFALILFLAEIKVTSHGLLAIGGTISMLLGSILLIDTPATYLRISWAVIIPAVVTTVLFFLFAVGMGLRAQRRKPTTGDKGMVGERGRAVTAVGPAGGQVFVRGEYWKAAAAEEIPAGASVEVIKADGLTAEVRRL